MGRPSYIPSDTPSLFPTQVPTIEPTMKPSVEPTIEPTLNYINSLKTTLDSADSNEIVTKDGDIRIFDQENDTESTSSTTFIGIAGMVVCFLCFGVLMFVHSKRKKDEFAMTAHPNIDSQQQQMTLIHVDDDRRARLQSETIYKIDAIKTTKKKNTMTYSVQSSEDQQYLPITYDGNDMAEDGMNTIAAVPEEDEMSGMMLGNVPNESSESLEQAIQRKRSRGSIVRSELKQLSKHMADVLHSNQ